MIAIRRVLQRLVHDQRGMVVGFLVRTALAFAILGLALEETGQILLTSIHAHGAAGAAAQAAANTYAQTQNLQQAKQAAQQAATANEPDARVTSVKISTDGNAAFATVVETAKTVVVQRVGFLKHFGVVHASEQEAHATA
jgi:Flp pilus assembly protein TadG